MVVDRIENLAEYEGILPGLREVYHFLRARKPGRLAPGRYSIKDETVYAVLAEAGGRPAARARLEAHRKYADVHLLLEGSEDIGWSLPGSCAAVLRRYDPKADMEEFSGRPGMWVRLRPRWFAIFMPGEPHAPLVSDGVVRKIVFKVKCAGGFRRLRAGRRAGSPRRTAARR